MRKHLTSSSYITHLYNFSSLFVRYIFEKGTQDLTRLAKSTTSSLELIITPEL